MTSVCGSQASRQPFETIGDPHCPVASQEQLKLDLTISWTAMAEVVHDMGDELILQDLAR